MSLEDLNNISILDLEEYYYIRSMKNKLARSQKWEDALKFRDIERLIIRQYPILEEARDEYEIIRYIRERKINEILS